MGPIDGGVAAAVAARGVVKDEKKECYHWIRYKIPGSEKYVPLDLLFKVESISNSRR